MHTIRMMINYNYMYILILQISYGSSADILANRQLYRNHFQMYTRESTYLLAIADMVTYYGWSQLGIITQNEDLFTEV